MRGSGGTEGGTGMFFIGLALAGLGGYLFFDSVRVTTDVGFFSGMMRGGRGGGHGAWETTSMGILFVPFLIGVIALFYNAQRKWGWWMLYFGMAVLTIEILSRIRFFMNTKLTHLLGIMVLFGAGVGLIMRSYRASRTSTPKDDDL
jgi:hypothetical protein